MPDDSMERQVHVMYETVRRLEGTVEDFARALRSNGKPGLFEKVRNNEEAIAALRASIEKLANSVDVAVNPGTNIELEKTRIQVLGLWAEKAGLITALAMGVANAMGWL